MNATVHTSNNGTADVDIKITNADGSELASHSGSSNTALTFKAEGAELWSPDSPTLYNVSVTLGDDVISSYTAFRTISRGEVNGIQRPLLNGEFVFQFGTLDQGYWPDGLYTPPNREAMEYDLKMLKDLGFNMLRKHVSLALWSITVSTWLTVSIDQSRDCSILPIMRPARLDAHPGHAFPPTLPEPHTRQLHS